MEERNTRFGVRKSRLKGLPHHLLDGLDSDAASLNFSILVVSEVQIAIPAAGALRELIYGWNEIRWVETFHSFIHSPSMCQELC